MKLWSASFSITSSKCQVLGCFFQTEIRENIHKVETYFTILQHLSLGIFTPHKVALLISNCKFKYVKKKKTLQNLSSPFQRNPILSFSVSSIQRFMPQFLSSFKSLFHTDVSLCREVAPSLRATAGTQSLKCSST